jgi:hypothetical protein
MKRYAIVRNARSRREAEAYLPANYEVVHEGSEHQQPLFVIEGKDDHGWTLDGYVIPRYASGLIWAEEIDLSHPIMKEVPLKARDRRPVISEAEYERRADAAVQRRLGNDRRYINAENAEEQAEAEAAIEREVCADLDANYRVA